MLQILPKIYDKNTLILCEHKIINVNVRRKKNHQNFYEKSKNKLK